NQLVCDVITKLIITLQEGKPKTLSCSSETANGNGNGINYGALLTGEALKLGLHDATDSKGLKHLSWFGNAGAFTQPCVLGSNPPAPAGCVDLTGNDALGGLTQVAGPGFHRMDFSIF